MYVIVVCNDVSTVVGQLVQGAQFVPPVNISSIFGASTGKISADVQETNGEWTKVWFKYAMVSHEFRLYFVHTRI